MSIRSLRGVEHTWRQAMAVDDARATADGQLRGRLEAATGGEAESDVALRIPLEAVGEEAASRLAAYERELDDRRILDPKVSKLRDEMVAALRFRRFQMGPDRRVLGDTPIELVDAMVDDQMERWRLDRSSVPPIELRSYRPAIRALADFTDAPTGARLVGILRNQVVGLDLDANRSVSSGPSDTTGVYSVPGGVAVHADGKVRVVTVVGEAPEGELPADRVLPTGSPDGALWLVHGSLVAEGVPARDLELAHLTSKGVSGGPHVLLPPDRIVMGGTTTHLVLTSLRTAGKLELWEPATGKLTELTPSGGRFLAAAGDVVLWQGPLAFSDTGNGGFLHLLHVSTGERDLIALARTDAASASISPTDGTIAVAAGPLAGRLGSVLLLAPGTTALVGTPGPRVAVDGPALTWSADGRSLFWRTPDGRLAMWRDGNPATATLVRTGITGLTGIAATGR
jgi:hypothetical protein